MRKFKYDVSVIVPVYNNEDYIDECVTSLLKQDYDINKIQIILINDGSKDKSLEKIKKYESENIIVIDKKNSGVSDTRNLGMSMALGKYILFLDSDDYLKRNSIKKLVELFDEHYNEIDVVTYPLVYNEDGKLRKHIRYNTMYEKGTGVYDLKEHYNLIQATVNIMIKNNFEKNILFEVKQKFSEDERFATEHLMQKQKIGFCKEAIYYYRRHVGTANDTITNAYYSFEMICSYYEYLFSKFENKGKVPKYIQTLYLNNICWRIKQDALYPYHYDEKKFEKSLDRIKKLLDKVDVDVVLSLPYMNDFHKMYVLKLKGEKVEIEVKKNGSYKIICNGEEIVDLNYIKSTVNLFKVRDGNILLNGFFSTLAFEVVDPDIYIELIDKKGNVEAHKIETYITNNSYYASKIKTNLIYGYNLKIDMNKYSEFKFYVIINGVRIPVRFEFNRFTSRKIYPAKYRVAYTKRRFKISKNNLYLRLKDLVKNLITYIKKNPRILVYRLLAKLTIKKKQIWLYSDKGGTIDNAYFQFKHDLKKKDGVLRFYVYNESFKTISEKVTKEESKYLLKFKTLKHKRYFLRADKILSSFSDLQIYCPFNNGIKWYRDIIDYDFIYLQHGILHANLIKMYSKEFTEISKFVISSNFEENNLKNKYNYSEEDFIKSGMPRMGLEHKKVKVQNKILYAPSWREYLIGKLVNTKRKLKVNEFLKSNYFKETYNFLHSEKLNKMLEENKLTLDFQLHPIFKEYGKYFELDNIKNVNLVSGKIVLEEYKIFITDFSSFQFDFVRLHRPIIYFMPDMDEFKAGLHTYRELDLDYKDAFGKLCLTSDDLVKEILYYPKNNYEAKKLFKDRMEKFFIKIDNPCEEIYKAIKK